MAIPKSFIEELVARSDIVEVVSDYVQLTKRSGSNMFGLCPFHSEKTPSFSVSPDKQIYHCFGCGKGGGVIGFIMEIENLPYRDAVAFLARRAGLEVPEDEKSPEERSRRARLLELNRRAARYFYSVLSTPRGAAAVEYINSRRLTPKTVKAFGIGAAPDEWTALSDAMCAEGFTESELLEAGLAKKGRNGGIYDVFRNRLVFPVIDVRGSVIGFSGRILGEGEPKYLNTPDTPVFTKSRNLFALNIAKRTKRGMLILAEGNVDVVMLHQAGFDCAVASLGTSLTAEQARLMSRYTKDVVIAYDSDAAGVKAAQRAIGLLEPAGLKVRVLKIPDAKDPDEFIKTKGPEAFELLLERSENQVDYRIDAVRARYDLETDDGRLGFLGEVTDLLASLPGAVEREIYSRKVAELIGVSPEAVQSEVRRAARRRASGERRRTEREAMRPEAAFQPRDRSLRYDNVASAAAEEGLIGYIMADPSLLRDTEDLSPEDFSSKYLGEIFRELRSRFSRHEDMSPGVILSTLGAEEAARLSAILQKPVSLGNAAGAIADYIDRIKTEGLKTGENRDLLAVRDKLKQKKGLGG